MIESSRAALWRCTALLLALQSAFGDEFSGLSYYYSTKDGHLVATYHWSDACDECGCGYWEGTPIKCKCQGN